AFPASYYWRTNEIYLPDHRSSLHLPITWSPKLHLPENIHCPLLSLLSYADIFLSGNLLYLANIMDFVYKLGRMPLHFPLDCRYWGFAYIHCQIYEWNRIAADRYKSKEYSVFQIPSSISSSALLGAYTYVNDT